MEPGSAVVDEGRLAMAWPGGVCHTTLVYGKVYSLPYGPLGVSVPRHIPYPRPRRRQGYSFTASPCCPLSADLIRLNTLFLFFFFSLLVLQHRHCRRNEYKHDQGAHREPIVVGQLIISPLLAPRLSFDSLSLSLTDRQQLRSLTTCLWGSAHLSLPPRPFIPSTLSLR